MKIRNHNLTSLVLVGVLVISIFTLFFAASISYKQIQSLSESEELVLHSYKVDIELAKLLLTVKDAETSQRGFLLTKDPSFLKPYNDAHKKVKASFVKLKLLVYDNAEQSKNLDTLFYLINQRVNYLENVLIQCANKEVAPDSFKKIMLQGKQLMKLMQTQVDKIVATELDILRKRESQREKDINLSPLSILFIVLLSLFVFVMAYFRINKDLKGLTKTNNQLLINKEIYEHSEQIANVSNWYWEIEADILTYSKNLYRLFGCEPHEFEPTLENYIEFVHPDDRHLVIEGNQKALKELISSTICFRVIRKDGELRYFKSIGKVIADNYGKTIIIGVNADITEQYNKDKMIAEKLADLEKSNKQLSAFNHIASHDLQEPLRKVQTFISRIRGKDFETFPEKVKDYFLGIERATVRMQKFIEDLLLYSRANNADKVFELTDLNVLLENTKQELSQLIEEKNVIVRCSSLLPTLNVIPFQIQQLFINIISNSIKYSKPGIDPVISVDTTIVSGKDLPDSLSSTDDKFYKISISDNVIGFNQEYAENIFTLFYRLHSEKEYSGTGIGLTICKIIVENHKGFIFAEGIHDVGSTICIYLPA